MSRMSPKAPVPVQGQQQGHSFSSAPSADIQRSKFDYSAVDHTLFDAGLLIPIYNEPVLPGDTWQMSLSMLVRYATLQVPIFDQTFIDVHWWFVPHRLVWEHWVNFMGEQITTDFISPGDYTVPQLQLPVGLTGDVFVGSIYDYFGYPMPPFVGVSPTAGPLVDALELRAYNLTYAVWYRDQNLVGPPPIRTGDSGDLLSDYVLLRRGKRHDYFTSCLPWAQKGDAVTIPFATSTAPVTGEIFGPTAPSVTPLVDVTTDEQVNQFNLVPAGGPQGNLQSGGIVGTVSGGDPMEFFVPANSMAFSAASGPGFVVDLTAATQVTINTLRQGIAVQQLLERDARGGTRYTEILHSHFGVISPDARLQRPEFLGSSSGVVGIYSVPQSTPASGGSTAQASLAAFGMSTPGAGGFSHSFTEHGTILGILSVRAPYTYTQGLRREASRQTRYDFYWPTFAMLGEQAVLNQEIAFSGLPGTSSTQDQGAFGYQERWAEYRYRPNRATNLFRTNVANALVQWELAQNFSALPALNQDFIEENPPTDQVVVVEEVDGPAFKADFSFQDFRDSCASDLLRPWPSEALMSLAANSVAGAGVGSSLGPFGTIAGAAIGAGASLFGDLFQSQSSAGNVQQQEAYQTQMADTQYQRTVADMKAAGLNPLAMFSGGGSLDAAPGGSVAQPGQYGNVGAGAAAGMGAADDVMQEQASLASQQLGLREQEADIALKNSAAIGNLQRLGANNNGVTSASQEAAADAITSTVSASQDSSLLKAQNSMGTPYWLAKAIQGTPIPGVVNSAAGVAAGAASTGLLGGSLRGAAASGLLTIP